MDNDEFSVESTEDRRIVLTFTQESWDILGSLVERQSAKVGRLLSKESFFINLLATESVLQDRKKAGWDIVILKRKRKRFLWIFTRWVNEVVYVEDVVNESLSMSEF